MFYGEKENIFRYDIEVVFINCFWGFLLEFELEDMLVVLRGGNYEEEFYSYIECGLSLM